MCAWNNASSGSRAPWIWPRSWRALAPLRLGPGWPVALTRPMMLVWAGAVLLGAGLARDLARLALREPRVTPAPDPHPGELRRCLESRLGLGAVVAGLAWRLWGAGGAPVLVPVGGGVLTAT